jgi:hypothetical protein
MKMLGAEKLNRRTLTLIELMESKAAKKWKWSVSLDEAK